MMRKLKSYVIWLLIVLFLLVVAPFVIGIAGWIAERINLHAVNYFDYFESVLKLFLH